MYKKKRPELPSAPEGGSAHAGVLTALMRRCWSHEPKKRPSFASIEMQLKPQVQSTGEAALAAALSEVRQLRSEMSAQQQAVSPLLKRMLSSSTLPDLSTSSNAWSSSADVPLESPDVFISFRFGEAHVEAIALKEALEARGLKAFVSDMTPGGNLQRVIAHALMTCRLAVVLATKTYGRETNGLFCTSAEMNFIVGQKKPYYLVRMIPFGDEWAEPATIMAFPHSIMFKLWLPGDPMPEGTIDEIDAKLSNTVSGAAQVCELTS